MAREKFPSDDVDRMMVRFPAGMRNRLKAAADTNKRSMNAEIVARLQNSLENTDFFEHPVFNLNQMKHLDRSGLVIAHSVIEELIEYLGLDPKQMPRHISEQLESVAFMRNLVAHGPSKAENIRENHKKRYYSDKD